MSYSHLGPIYGHLWSDLHYWGKFANFGPNPGKRSSSSPDLEKIHNFPLLATAIGQTWPDPSLWPLGHFASPLIRQPLDDTFGQLRALRACHIGLWPFQLIWA